MSGFRISCGVSFRFSEEKGRILENIVFNELRRRQQKIFFHKQKGECDFIIKTELKITSAIQVCLTLSDVETKNREINGLLEALNTYQLKEGLILTLDEEGEESITYHEKQYTVRIQPVSKWLLPSFHES